MCRISILWPGYNSGFHAVVVFGLGKDLLFKSVLGRCVQRAPKNSVLAPSVLVLYEPLYQGMSKSADNVPTNSIQTIYVRIFIDLACALELVSKELNHLAAILHVFAGGLNFMK